MEKTLKLGLAFGLVSLWLAMPAYGREYLVEQKNKQFWVDGKPAEAITIKEGDTIAFVNNDPFVHNIFSDTPGQEFDLGAFPSGQAPTYQFQSVGTVEVKCALHGVMILVVTVTPR